MEYPKPQGYSPAQPNISTAPALREFGPETSWGPFQPNSPYDHANIYSRALTINWCKFSCLAHLHSPAPKKKISKNFNQMLFWGGGGFFFNQEKYDGVGSSFFHKFLSNPLNCFSLKNYTLHSGTISLRDVGFFFNPSSLDKIFNSL